MKQVNIHEAKTKLSELLLRVQGGEEITIAKSGRPVARLVPIGTKVERRCPGTAKGKIVIRDDFDLPLSGDVLSEFES